MRAVLDDMPISKDILVLTPSEYATYRTWASSVAHRADVEGVVLYEAA